MASPLTQARQFVGKLRFSFDREGSSYRQDNRELSGGVPECFLLQEGIEVSPALTPVLHQRLEEVCSRLKLPPRSVTAFIRASHEYQAVCFATDRDQCTILFSSALVDLLDADEFEFVAGHEIGHFLLNHCETGTEDRTSAGYLIESHSHEISADRVGLHACRSLDTAIRALMKTVSGLTGRHVRFDVGAFVAQLRRVSHDSSPFSSSTHPSMVIRSRALLWHSMTDFYRRGDGFYSSAQMHQIDARIERDLVKFVDGATKRELQAARDDLLLWMATQRIVQTGSFRMSAQVRMRNRFGDSTVNSLLSFLSDVERDEVTDMVQDKILQARLRLEKLVPTSFMNEMEQLEGLVSACWRE
jgi:Peptidase family M48